MEREASERNEKLTSLKKKKSKQRYHYNVANSRVEQHVDKGNDDGLYISSVACCQELWALIMDAVRFFFFFSRGRRGRGTDEKKLTLFFLFSSSSLHNNKKKT